MGQVGGKARTHLAQKYPQELVETLVTAIKQRYKDNKEGRMNSVLFIYTKSESEEISGHIDLSARC